jgi:hypothetical protein
MLRIAGYGLLIRVILIIIFRYARSIGPKISGRQAARRVASLRLTMPFVALRVVLQEMAVGLLSANPFAAQSVRWLPWSYQITCPR